MSWNPDGAFVDPATSCELGTQFLEDNRWWCFWCLPDVRQQVLDMKFRLIYALTDWFRTVPRACMQEVFRVTSWRARSPPGRMEETSSSTSNGAIAILPDDLWRWRPHHTTGIRQYADGLLPLASTLMPSASYTSRAAVGVSPRRRPPSAEALWPSAYRRPSAYGGNTDGRPLALGVQTVGVPLWTDGRGKRRRCYADGKTLGVDGHVAVARQS
jgi:hypothetical protein